MLKTEDGYYLVATSNDAPDAFHLALMALAQAALTVRRRLAPRCARTTPR